ncbi:hypothetical protein HMI54_001899, partial [Coelomomyces lativittatus]
QSTLLTFSHEEITGIESPEDAKLVKQLQQFRVSQDKINKILERRKRKRSNHEEMKPMDHNRENIQTQKVDESIYEEISPDNNTQPPPINRNESEELSI